MTHEDYIHKVRELVAGRVTDISERELLMSAKLVYGRGQSGLRGVTCYGQWHNNKNVDLVEVCAHGEESPIQLAGTVIHELAHVLSGLAAGHGKDWKDRCKQLGLPGAKATMTQYDTVTGVWDENVLAQINELGVPLDGKPQLGIAGLVGVGGLPVGVSGGSTRTTRRGCATGQKKQTARLRLWECKCEPKPIKIRSANDNLQVMCMVCGKYFEKHTN